MEEIGGTGSSIEASKVMGAQSELDMPIGAKYVVWTQFLLRFSLKGTQVVLVMYLFEHVGLSENLSAEMVHVYLTVVNVVPILGAVLSDGYLGKYQTMFCSLLVEVTGMVILVLGAVPNVDKGWRVIVASASAVGLLVLAVGSGGVKPTIAALGGDQVEVLVPEGAERDRLRSLFFSMWYLSLNLGSCLATIAIPPLRTLGSYSLIFSVQTAVLGGCLVVFRLGRSHYVHRQVKENVFVKVGSIMFDALKIWTRKRARKWRAGDVHSPEVGEQEHILPDNEMVDNGRQDLNTVDFKYHWLDETKLKHDASAVDDVKLLLRVLTLFTAMPFFWALFEQQYTKWVFQSNAMNLKVSWLGGLVMQPEQIQALNPLLVLIIIPALEKAIYPFCRKCNIPLPPLRKMVIGMASTVLAFVASGVLQLAIDNNLKSDSSNQIGKVSVFWQVPQYFFITLAEVLINVTGLEFAYSQAPASMKSLLQASWQVSQGIGDFMTAVVIAIIGNRLSKANEFFLFAGGCAAALLWLVWISQGYEDVQREAPTPPDPLLAQAPYLGLVE
ncbi:unnamed protein product [Calypogeia fissa]